MNTAGWKSLLCRGARYPACVPIVLVTSFSSTMQMLKSGVKHTLCLLLLMVPRHLLQLFGPRTQESHDTVQCLMEWMDTFHCTPLSVCADMAFQSSEVPDLFRCLNIRPFFFHRPLHSMAEQSRSSRACFQTNFAWFVLTDWFGTWAETSNCSRTVKTNCSSKKLNGDLWWKETLVELVFGRNHVMLLRSKIPLPSSCLCQCPH